MKLKKTLLTSILAALVFMLAQSVSAQVAPEESPEVSPENPSNPEVTPEEQPVDPKAAKRAKRRAEAIAETKALLASVTDATNTLTEELNAAEKGKQVANALEKWAKALDVFSKKAKALEGKKGFKFLKKKEPPAELQEDLQAFNAAIENMQAALTPKVEMFQNNPKFQKRMQAIFAKLQNL